MKYGALIWQIFLDYKTSNIEGCRYISVKIDNFSEIFCVFLRKIDIVKQLQMYFQKFFQHQNDLILIKNRTVDNKVFISFDRTDIIQICKIIFYYNRFSILTKDSLKFDGSF